MSDDLRRFERSHLWVGHVEDITNERDALRQALEEAQRYISDCKCSRCVAALARIHDILGGEND